MKTIYIKKSKIDSKGVFAKEPIKKGETVFVVKGHIHTFHPDDDSWLMQNAIGHSPNKWINPLPDNPLRFTNHSCSPNCILGRGLKVIALYNIQKHEEITIDYSLTEADPNSHMGSCKCRTKNCRKEITNIHEIPHKIVQKHKKHLPEWILKKWEEYKKTNLSNNKSK